MNVGITSFTQLQVWKKAHQVVLDVYKATRSYPAQEQYGLTAQMRRAAISVPANIAEGFGRQSPKDKARMYNIANGSTEEMKYFVLLSKDLGYLPEPTPLTSSLEEISRMLRKLTQVILDA